MINSISITNFRNYINFEIDDFSKLNIFLGPNASGKTNLIEAISLVCSLNSLRHSKTSQMINKHSKCDYFRICATHNVNNSFFELVLYADELVKKYKLNNKIKSIKDLKGKFTCVCFSPDDIFLIKGSNSLRLRDLDLFGCQLSRNYYTVYRDYNKVLRQKNSMLKHNPNLDVLKSLNDVLVITGSQLSLYRDKLVNKIKPYLNQFFIDDSIDIEYMCSYFDKKSDIINARQMLRNALSDSQEAELISMRSLVGPHKDRLFYKVNNQDASFFASQGQQRSIVLASKLAQLTMFNKTFNSGGILLLDDVMSELDDCHRENLLKHINIADQVFITTTNRNYFSGDFLSKASIYNIRELIE